jgi:plasmid stabilization system protein ParE
MLIRRTLPATGDLTQICDYVEQHGSAAAARRIALSIYDGVTTLKTFPHKGALAEAQAPVNL